MNKWDLEKIRPLLERLHNKRKLLLALSILVVFITTYLLILPAFTLDADKARDQGGIDVPGVTAEEDAEISGLHSEAAKEAAAESKGREASEDAENAKGASEDAAKAEDVSGAASAEEASAETTDTAAADAEVSGGQKSDTDTEHNDLISADTGKAVLRGDSGTDGTSTAEEDTAEADIVSATPEQGTVAESQETAGEPEKKQAEELSENNASEKSAAGSTTQDPNPKPTDTDTEDMTDASAENAAADPLTFEGEGYTVKVSDPASVLPAGTEVRVEEIAEEDNEEDYRTYFDDTLRAVQADAEEQDGRKVTGLRFARFYNITLVADGEEITPDDTVRVSIEYDDTLGRTMNVEDADRLRVVHFAEDKKTGEAEPEVLESKAVEVSTDRKDRLTEAVFEADQFSVYAVVYTVDFEYSVDGEKHEFSLAGGGAMSLKQLITDLGVIKDDADTAENEIDLFMSEISSAEFTSPELVTVIRADEDTTVGALRESHGLTSEYSADISEDQITETDSAEIAAGDWALISLKPFDTEETLTITMKNGDEWAIRVTDAHEIPDSASATIDVTKSYLICYEANGRYYLLKNDGSVDSSKTPADFEGLNSTYCWTFNYVFEEKHLEDTLTYTYYLIRPIDNKSKTIALNADGNELVQSSNNNVAVVPAEGGGFHLIGYNEVKLNFVNGQFIANQLPAGNDGIVVHIYVMDTLPTYSYMVRSSDENRGTVTVAGGTQHTADDETHYYEASSNSDKKNAGTITATPANHKNNELQPGDTGYGQNKWEFDHWEQDGIPLDRDQYPATINTNTLPIHFNGSNLVAHFKQNANYVVPNSEKQPSSFEDMTNWFNDLTTRDIPLDKAGTTKTAEVYDYENRIYRVDITSKADFETFDGNVDMAFCLDVSNSMKFPSKLVENTALQIYQINNSNTSWLDINRGYDNPYYLIADPNGTATVFKIYYKGGEWRAIDASRPNDDNNKQWFRIGNDFETTWTKGKNLDNNHPFNVGDNDYTYYTIYDAGDSGRNRFYYLNQSLLGATTDLQTIKDTLAVAGAQSPQVRVAYNTFNKYSSSDNNNLPSGYSPLVYEDFQTVHPLTVDFSYSAGGGTRPDRAFIDALNFSWSSNDRYVILITDGAPQGARGDDPDGTTSDDIYQMVRQSAQNLKNEKEVKLITIGLSMDDVTSGKQLLYDLADDDKDGNKMFYMAESASDLPNILRQITKTIMDEAIVYSDVTDTVGEAFYPVDKTTGFPLQANDMIDIEGRKVTDSSKAAGIVQSDGITIKWLGQAIDPTNGWHGTVYVKAKEDLIGGNAVKTNGAAEVKATGYRMGDTDYSFDTSLVHDKLKSLEVDLSSPRVNVNELTFPNASTEWTVYLGTEVDPEEQLKKMYEDILVKEVVNTDGSLHYPIEPNSIVDDRTGGEHGTAQTFQLAPVILDLIKADTALAGKYVKNNALDWDTFLTDIQKADGVVVPYHVYGVEGEDSNITIKLTKDILSDEADVNNSPHPTTVVNDTDGEGKSIPVEKYVLTVQYNPDYDHVLPAGQGGHGTYEYHTGTYGTMYQGHATGRETSTNTHVINVFAKKLELDKVDQEHNLITGSAATFGLYRKATAAELSDDSVVKYDLNGLTGKYVLIQEISTDDNTGKVTTEALKLLDNNEAYYLAELTAPDGFNTMTDVLKVMIDMDGHNTWTRKSDGATSQTKPSPYAVSDWQQEATIKVTALDGTDSGYAIRVLPEGEHEISYDSVNDTTDAYVKYMIVNNSGAVLPHTGGIGTHVIYLIGLTLILGSGAMLIRRRAIHRG